MMDCVSLLFIMLRGAKDTAKREKLERGKVLPPKEAFMDDVTILIKSRSGTECLLQRLNELFTWCRMKAKP